MFNVLSKTLFILLLPIAAHAEWVLNPSSSELSFVSVKKELISEHHKFRTLSGRVDDSGQLHIQIELSSVDTMIPIRNERLKEHLFQVAEFPTADVSAKVDYKSIGAILEGTSKRLSLPISLTLHGHNKTYQAEISVIKLAGNQLQVQSVQPIIVSAADFDLIKGIDVLKGLAGLPSIEPLVPVTFLLTFNGK